VCGFAPAACLLRAAGATRGRALLTAGPALLVPAADFPEGVLTCLCCAEGMPKPTELTMGTRRQRSDLTIAGRVLQAACRRTGPMPPGFIPLWRSPRLSHHGLSQNHTHIQLQLLEVARGGQRLYRPSNAWLPKNCDASSASGLNG
jgi:hypothetical protein